MKLGERACLFLNSLLPRIVKIRLEGRESPQAYSEAQYRWAQGSLALYDRYIDLKDKVVLDAGCGLGGKTVFYAEKGCRSIFGVDLDSYHVKHAREFASRKKVTNARFTVASLASIPFASNTFDIIILNDVVEHISRDLLISALHECKRVVKPNGRVCLEFPPWTSHDAAHMYDYIHIPWMQQLFSDETLINVTRRLNPKPRYGRLSVIEHFQELNRITINESKQIIRDLGMRVAHFDLQMIRNMRFLKYIPLFNRYFTTRVVVVLSK